jgi:hypothetical protein
LLLLFEEL